ncbi:XisH family protein [Nostoc sp. CHAB 5715]|uniref:XisH family protein n=1 Tax=Nostoc sp. CHAB 5715 TaxID=2780400 RepID=UPI001E42371E|nr:XisH family protein [Nostoc sp. CHAB 5715]MCC5620192.1 XisH family protein [Nostoc sp. CHAB 5715]
MAAKDIFHDVVRRALEKEGWLITNDPLFLRFGGLDMYIDLGAEKVLAAERNQEKIAVEVKSFVAPSTTTEFSTALVGWVKQSATQQSPGNVGFRSSNATCFKSGNPPNAVAPQPTQFKVFSVN